MLVRLFSHKSAMVATSEQEARGAAERLLKNRPGWRRQLVNHPDSLRDVERAIDREARIGGGRFLAALLQEVSEDPAWPEQVRRRRREAAGPTKAPRAGRSRFRLLCGIVLYVTTLYCPPKASCGAGSGRRDEERDERRAGVFPELAALGISLGGTPAMTETVARTAAVHPSMDVARRELAQQGTRLDQKTVRRIAVQFGEQILALRRRELMAFREGRLPAGDELAGRRVAVQIDGGRLRTRRNKPSRKKRNTGARPKFDTPWREPKALVIFVFDERGQMVGQQRHPLIDGTLRGPNHTAELVAYHLHRLGAAEAERVVFLADGARWIWDRIDWIIKRSGIPAERTEQVLDFCHAAHHISLALEALGYTGPQRTTEYRRLRKQLKAGRWEAVTGALIDLACDAPTDSDVWTEIDYLLLHGQAGRLDYSRFRRAGLPRGSGAIESAIRRVINLRLKSNGMFWREEHAEALFAVRALWLSGRWTETLTRVRRSMATDRRRRWTWEAADLSQELNAAGRTDSDSQQNPRSHHVTNTAA